MRSKLACGSPYCDQPGLVYVARTLGASGRLTVITGDRAEQLGSANPVEVRCIDCAHHEMDLLIADLPTVDPKAVRS